MVPGEETVAAPADDEPATEPVTEPAAGPPAGTLKLACDAMLGRLSRDLRGLGVDCSYRRGLGGLRAWQKARVENRAFLTRNNKLNDKEGVVFVEAKEGRAQLEEVCRRYGLEPPAAAKPKREAPGPVEPPPPRAQPAPPESGPRCRDCNVTLEKITREQARPTIPYFIYQIHHDFARCPKCKRVFWPGSHTHEPQQRSAEQPARPRRRRRSR